MGSEIIDRCEFAKEGAKTENRSALKWERRQKIADDGKRCDGGIIWAVTICL